ncbi:hypothetical protein HC928_15985 [bacterium]|nr:hypothetical protein [bacterium]
MLETATDAPATVPAEVLDEDPTSEPSQVPTVAPTEEATVIPAPVLIEESPVPPAEEPVASEAGDDDGLPLPPPEGAVDAETISCQMSIDDAADTNPFTFNFAAVNTNGIAAYRWDFDNDGSDDSSAQSDSFTYTATGSFTVKLYCTPTGGLPDLELTGNVTISAEPPVADFVVNPVSLSGFAPLTVYLTNTSTGSELSYSWSVTGPENFGPVTTENASFTLTQVGSYTISLTATDGISRTNTSSVTVIVSEAPPQVNFTLSPISGTSPLMVTVQGVYVGGGSVTSWNWDFGGLGTATGQGPHTFEFTAEDVYDIVLSVNGPGGTATVTKQVGVFPALEPVTAEYTYTLMGEVVPGTIRVCFANTSEGPVTQSVWTFGSDGSATDNSDVVCHDFSAEGLYLVNLEVTGTDPNITSNREKTVDVVGAPVAAIGVSSSQIDWRGTVDFTGSGSTGSITSYAWDFDDDGLTDSTDADPSGIEFATIGGNRVRLTVTGEGGVSTAEVVITVSVRDITCDFSGPLSVLPGSTQAYTSTIGDLMGRDITYNWTVNGTPVNQNTPTPSVNLNDGANTVSLIVIDDDGASSAPSATTIRTA